MNTEKELFITAVKGLIYNNQKTELSEILSRHKIDWVHFKELITYHELTPFMYLVFKEYSDSLPSDLEEFLRNNYYCAIIRCQNIWQEFLQVAEAFEKAGVGLVPIKGVALLEDVYSQNPIRPMTDIDVLVKEEDIPKTEEIFSRLEYRKEMYGLKEEYWRTDQCHITFYPKTKKKTPFIELHWLLDFKRKNRDILPDLWKRVRRVNVGNKTIKLLSPEDNLFSLALHPRRFGKTLSLKNVVDLAMVLNKYRDFDWDYVIKEARRGKMCSTVYFILAQLRLILGYNIPANVGTELKIPPFKKNLIQRFIGNNTFTTTYSSNHNLYLRGHFLLYDSFWEPAEYILNIPREQFAKFYGLAAYNKKTDFLYRNRIFYIPYRAVFSLIRK